MSDLLKVSPESAAEHMRTLQATMGWQILVRYYAEEREAILTEGKKARSFDKTCNLFKILEGFDKAISLPERIINAGAKYADQAVEED